MFKKALFLAGTSYFLYNRKITCSPQPPLSMILRGQYQNKIRRFSPPQKIFDVFATIYSKGRLYMSLTDLLKAICFYNYSKSDQSLIANFKPYHILKFLGKEKKFEIYDYFILARFLAYDKQKMREYFWKKNILELTENDFRQFLQKQICSDYVNHIKSSILIESRQFKPNYQQFEKKINIISKSVYDQKQTLSFEDLERYRRRMVQQLYEFQFRMFPVQNGTIDGMDFARSIIKYVEPQKTKKYTKRIKKMVDLENVKVDIKAYKAFHMYMSTNMGQIQRTLNERGAISTEQLQHLINQYVNKKGSVSKEQINVVVRILDHDNSGFLQKKQVLGVLKNLQYYTTVKSGQLTFIQSLKRDFQKIVQKLTKIQQILQQ